MKKLIVHIGLPKTGSTTIQTSLRKNTQTLSENGVSFIDLQAHGTLMSDSLAYNLLFKGSELNIPLRLKYNTADEAERQLLSLKDCFSKLHPELQDSVIISSERMTLHLHDNDYNILDMNSIREIVSFCNNSQQFELGQIIIYIRRQDYFYNSMMNNELKVKGVGAAKFDVPNFNEKLNELDRFLIVHSAATKFDVRNFDLAVKAGLEQDFYKCIGVNDFEPLCNIANVSVSAEELLLYLGYTDLVSGDELHSQVNDCVLYKRLLQEFSSEVPKRKVLFLTYEEQKDLLDQVYEENKAFFKKFKMGSSEEFEEWMSIKPEKGETVYFDSDDLALNKSAMELLLKAFVNLGKKVSGANLKVLANSFLNVMRFNQGKRVYIYGCGEHTRQLLQEINVGTKIAGIIDRNPTSETSLGFNLHKADDFDYSKADVIIISSKVFEKEIYLYLKKRVSEDQIVTLYSSY